MISRDYYCQTNQLFFFHYHFQYFEKSTYPFYAIICPGDILFELILFQCLLNAFYAFYVEDVNNWEKKLCCTDRHKEL